MHRSGPNECTKSSDPSYEIGLILLMFVTIIYMPFALMLAIPEATVNTRVIAHTLFLTMLVPLAAGQLVRWKAPGIRKRILPLLAPISTCSLIALVALEVVINYRAGIQSLSRRGNGR